MKRWGYKGLPASHGVSLAHRHPGSIGGRQDPGRIWKGKKLPGHMGNERRTLHNCLVYKVRGGGGRRGGGGQEGGGAAAPAGGVWWRGTPAGV